MSKDSKKGLNPVFNDEIEILILGSCPGDESIEKQEYYSSSSNNFWKLVGKIIEIDLELPYKEKIEILLKNHIGLWDVMRSCEREGSLDRNIKRFTPNDFSNLHLPKLRLILFNGKKAYKYKKSIRYDVKKRYLSSSANSYSIDFEEKLDYWKHAFND